MKRSQTFISFILVFQTCLVLAQNAWVKKTDFPGGQTGTSISSTGTAGQGFSIGTKGYLSNYVSGGTGFWEYDPAGNAWTQKANIPETRAAAVSFSIGNKG